MLMHHSVLTLLKKSLPKALKYTIVIVLLDIFFSSLSPRSILNLSFSTNTDKFVVLAMNFLLSYPIILTLVITHFTVRGPWVLIASILIMIIYLINWSTFFIIGEFLGLDGISFAIQNFEHLLWHMAQITPWYLVALVLIVLIPSIYLLPFRKEQLQPKPSTSSGQMTSIQVLWITILLIISYICLLAYFPKLPNHIRHYLKLRTSPQLTFLLDKQNSETSINHKTGMTKLDVKFEQQLSWEEYTNQTGLQLPLNPVILIIVESMRSDVLNSNEVMPNLYSLKTESIVTNAYAPSNITDNAWPAIFNSQYPLRTRYRYYHSKHVLYPRIAIYDILKRFGYQTAVFSAQNEQWFGMIHSFNRDSLDVFYSADTSLKTQSYTAKEDAGFSSFVKQFRLTGKLDDALVVEKAMKWISYQTNPRFFVAINLQRPHFPYTWPEDFQTPFLHSNPQQWSYPRNQTTNMRNRYYNALRYSDEQIGKLLQLLKKQNLYDESLIIIAGDHGESFHEHGTTCHGNSLFNESILTSVVIKPPKNHPTLMIKKTMETIDIAPGILNILKLPIHPSFQGQNPFLIETAKKPIFITVNSILAKQEAVILDHWKLIKDNRINQLMLYDLVNDPQERVNLTRLHPQKTEEMYYLLTNWRNEQLKYYSDPSQQKLYYPPTYSLSDQ